MIVMKNVHAGYGRAEVLKGVSLRFDRGTITAVIGPNGCGKSTLLKTAAGLVRPSSGEVALDGRNLDGIPRREAARLVSFLPQFRAPASLTVRELVMHGRFPYLGFPRHLSGRDENAVRAAMQTAGVSELQDRSLKELSGGERQKAYLAMAVAQDTETILWDEPATYLDINRQFEVLSIMRSLRGRGRAVAVVLHDLSQAFSVADRICLMECGKIAALGPPDAVYESRAAERVFSIISHRVHCGGRDLVFFTPEGGYPA